MPELPVWYCYAKRTPSGQRFCLSIAPSARYVPGDALYYSTSKEVVMEWAERQQTRRQPPQQLELAWQDNA